MKINNIEIYGFGKWEDKQFDFSNQSFIILSGDNETGKSTLRQFILFMLFGMPPKERRLYLPKRGGKLGGRLTLETDDGIIFTIERMHDRNKGEAVCYTSDGLTKDENWLNKQLSGIDKQTFLSIFSFDTTILTRLHQMKQQDIGEVLLGVGMAGTDQIYWTEKWLEQQLSDYFKPQGKKPKINQLVEALTAQEESLIKLQADADQYQEKQQEKDKLEKGLATYQEKQQLLNQQLQRIKQNIQHYDVIAAYQRIKQELSLYPDSIRFPEQGLERFDQLKRLLFPLQSEQNMLQMKLEKEIERLSQINQTMLTESEREALEGALKEIVRWNQLNQQLSDKRQEKHELEQQLINDINQVQLKLSLEEVQALSLPFATEESWLQLKEEQQEINQTITKLDHEYQLSDEQYNYLLNQQMNIDNQLINQSELNQLKQDLEREEQIIRMQERSDSNKKQQKKWNKIKQQKKKQVNRISIAGISVTLIVGLLGFILEDATWFIFSGVLLVVVIFVKWNMYQSTKSIEPFFESLANQIENRKLTDQELVKRKHFIEEQEKLQKQKQSLINQMREIDLTSLKLNETKQFYLQRQQLVNQKVAEQIENFPFLKGIAVKHWPKLYHHLEAIINQAKKYKDRTNKVKAIAQQMIDLEEDIKKTYQTYVAEPKSANTVASIDNVLRGMLDKDNVLLHKKGEVEENKQQLLKQLDELKAKITPIQSEINTLWEHANVHDEEAYLEKGKQKQTYNTLYNEYKTYQDQLDLLLSKQDWIKIANGEKIVKSDLETRYEQVKGDIEENREKIERLQQQIADLNAHIYQSETSQVLLDEKHRYYQLQNELEQKARQWAIYQLAKTKINDTKQIYYQHYLPTVLSYTSTYFKQLTDHYHTVLINEENGELLVEDKQGFRYTVQELSQGTQDQLYISLRIGMSMVIKRNHNMPFFVDDAFVHFDSTRLCKMIHMFINLSETRQIIWFTTDHVPLFCLENENTTIHKI
ncbi:hypothetical protein BN1058_01340 [Paraliobacillus sp. PM-2]|uniref:ATP-binding protein n=1 Tax=Paraliobacillus sp. PM-2 TaxID=1462524 RepID=UPI00061C5C0C|nr:AAA family ATPase [Paraliobacillus sp. PM-2]CQR47051.1 hypothetical protein BN1058_01340 [Paraliobacillus sp. PM-2]